MRGQWPNGQREQQMSAPPPLIGRGGDSARSAVALLFVQSRAKFIDQSH